MPTTPTTSSEPTTAELSPSTKGQAVEMLVDIAHEEASPQAFFKRALPVMARCLGCAYLQLEIRHGGTVLHEEWSHPKSDPEFWASQVESMMTDTMVEQQTYARIFEGRDIPVRVAFLCSPAGIGNRFEGGVVAVRPCRETDQPEEGLELLDVLCTLASSLAEGLGEGPSAESKIEASQDELTRIRKVADYTTETELAFAITNKLRTRDNSEQVILASVNGHDVRLLAISGTDSIAPRSPGVKLIRASIEECVDLRKIVVAQEQAIHGDEEGEIVTGGRLHQRWCESVGGGCAASIPLFKDDKLVAVLSVRKTSNEPFDAESLEELSGLVQPYAVGLEMVRIAHRSLKQHAVNTLRESLRELVGRGSYGRKAVAVCLTLLLGWAFFGKMTYSVQAPCELVPATSRQLAASSDGVLKATFAVPGDVVAVGDLLCKFDTSELELDRARLMSELEIFEIDRFRALDSGAPADVELATASAREVRANLALVEYRIEAASVFATTAGVVLEGEHRNRIGDVFSKGDPLFTIAPKDSWRLEVRVPEGDIGAIEADMLGEFASHSRPEDSFAFEVMRIAPAAEQRDGRNVFIVEAFCELPVDWVKAGMEGYASIDAGERPPTWVLFHRAIDYARLRLWL